MECLRRLFCHWQQDGNCDQQNPSVFHVHFPTYDGLPYYHLHGAGLLEKYAPVYLGSKKKSMVLFIVQVTIYRSLKSTLST